MEIRDAGPIWGKRKGGYLDFAKPLDILQPVSERSLGPEKVRLYTYLHIERSLCNSLLMCMFLTVPMTPMTINKLTEVTRAVTGWDLCEWEMMKVGEKGVTLARFFHLKHSLTDADDHLPSRMLELIRKSRNEGWVVGPKELAGSMKTHCGVMGWYEQGFPTRAKLAEMGLNIPIYYVIKWNL